MTGDLKADTEISTFPTALLSADLPLFKQHLRSRSTEISSAISQIFSRAPIASPETSQLQSRINDLLATEKGHIVELEKSRNEKEKLLERLEQASLRYMLAEKKIDRSKSATVAKLEKQAINGGRSDSGSGLGGANQELSNGQVESPADLDEKLLAATTVKNEAIAESQKRKEQLEALESENAKLTAHITTLDNRLGSLTDDDYSRTELFKHLRSQHEDVIKRINDLEATNVLLREEAQKLQSERTEYRVRLERESHKAIEHKDVELAQLESDLARIRSARDELIADQSMRKSAQAQERNAIDQIRELLNAKEERIKASDSEIARFRLQLGSPTASRDLPSDLDHSSAEELLNRIANLDKQNSLLTNELQSMEAAYKKTSTVASQKVNNLSVLEEKAVRLSAEKSRADQKYFAAMKAKEAREQELRTLRAQNSKSSEMVSSLKDCEAANRNLQINHEKQMAEYKDSITQLESRNRTAQQQLTEKTILLDGSKSQAEGLKKTSIEKDIQATKDSIARRQIEVKMEAMKVRLAETKKSLESWKSKGLGNQSQEYEMLQVRSPCGIMCNDLADQYSIRNLPSALSVTRISRTQSSKRAAMSFATTALKKGRLHDRENVRIVINLLA